MSDHRWIIMPIEVQRRELDAKLVVAALAASRGYKVLIGQDRVVRRLARFLPKGILFDKSIGGKGDDWQVRFDGAVCGFDQHKGADGAVESGGKVIR